MRPKGCVRSGMSRFRISPAAAFRRAPCLKNGRIYVYRHGSYLAALDTKTGEPLWRRTPEAAAELFEAIGPALDRQDWRTNWKLS